MKKILTLTKNTIDKKSRNIIVFCFLFFIIIISWKIFEKELIKIPTTGGTISEIQIGTHLRFVNPVLSNSNAEKDLLPLIYSSLLKKNNLGEIVPGISDMTISEDKKEYTIKIKEGVFFSDGTELTIDDVIFTIEKITDPQINSPYYGNWFGVKYKKITKDELKITLPQEYDQFKEVLASLYILPKHLWENFSPVEFGHNPLNINAVGSGPYIVYKVSRSESGKILKYNLERNKEQLFNKTFINNIIFYFFDNYQSYQKSSIFGNKKIIKNIPNTNINLIEKLSSKESYKYSIIEKVAIPRTFGLFLNKQSSSFLENKVLRKAISEIIDRNKITRVALRGNAQEATSPIFNFQKETLEKSLKDIKKDLVEGEFTLVEKDELNPILMENKKNLPSQPVIITLTTIDSEELISVSKNIKEDLKKIGITLNILSYKEDILANSIIRNRDFEMLLFGYETNINPDLYYFFHSSQISDPGINISETRNTSLDTEILELRKNKTKTQKDSIYKKVDNIISKEYSFIPLYSPYFIYIMDRRVKNFKQNIIGSREERFSNISEWYIKTKKILP